MKIKKIAIILIMIMLMSLFGVGVFTADGISEKVITDQKINDFKNQGVLVYCDLDKNIEYYEISSNEATRTFNYRYLYDADLNNDYIGSVGDIVITNKNPLKEYPFGEFMNWFTNNFYLGHATINYFGNEIIESEGKDEGTVRINDNSWVFEDNVHNVIGLKIKTSEETKKSAVSFCKDKLGLKYNWLFLFSFKNKFYCTDLITRAYQSVGVEINEDKMVSTGVDMISSSNTYIYYFKEKMYNSTRNEFTTKVYYLKSEYNK